jgi:hypothetical protein
MARIAFSLLLVVLCAGCTRVTVTKDPSPYDKGFRYYRPKPYLMITPGAVETEDKSLFTTTSKTKQGEELKIKSVSSPTPTSGRRSPVQLANGMSMASDFDPEPPISAETVLTPPEEPKAANESDVPQKNGEKSAEEVKGVKATISLMYLPDFSEEYSVRLRPGLGIGELSMQLDDGWNLTSVGMKTDQQTDEIINSVANLVGSAANAAAGIRGKAPQPIADVLATNVPFGLYEAIIATDPCGRKQLYGWRYVGFMPFQTCPVCIGGMQRVSCNDPNAIYGLVLDNTNTMRFEKVAEIPYMRQKVDVIEKNCVNYHEEQTSMSPMNPAQAKMPWRRKISSMMSFPSL